MTVPRYDITAARVLDDLPSNLRGVTSSSSGLSTTQIDQWIGEAAAAITAQLVRSGIDAVLASAGDSDVRGVAQIAILAYATAKALSKGGNADDPRIASAWARWAEAIATLREYPNDLGSATPVRVISNVPLDASRRDPMTFRDRRW